MKSQFGERVRELREQHNLYLRQVAPLLEMDTAQLSKIEKGLRQIKRVQVPKLAEILKVEKNELLALWVADQIIDVAKGEDVALIALQIAHKELLSKSTKMEDSGNQ